MNQSQVIDQIWLMKWYEVAYVAFVDDFILMCKIWPGILMCIFIAIAFCLVVDYNKRRKQAERVNKCFWCKHLFSDPDDFLDLDDNQEDTIIITDRLNNEFMVCVHRSCAIKWVNELSGVDRDFLLVESSIWLGNQIAKFLREKYHDDIKYLVIKVDTHGKRKTPDKILRP